MATPMCWTSRVIDAPAGELWKLLVELDRWPEWGPSVRHARLDGDRFDVGATGAVTAPAGVRLPFEITAFEPGERWAWKVLGLPATDHTVTSMSPERCEVGFGVPRLARPYLLVCDRALERLDRIASSAVVAPT